MDQPSAPFYPLQRAAFGIGGFTPQALPSDAALAYLQDLGVGSVRFDCDEPQALLKSVRPLAQTVDALAKQDVDTLLVLKANPQDWSRPDPWLEAAAALSKALRVRHWSVGYEPDAGWPHDRLPVYLEFFRQMRAVVTAGAPDRQIHLGGFGPGLPRSLQAMYDLGGRSLIDVVDIHLWMNPLMPDAIGGLRYLYDRIRQTLVKNGDGKKEIWWTEAGCPGVADGTTRRPWPFGKNPSERVQEAWLETHYSAVARWPGVGRVFWTALSDSPDTRGESACGLLRVDGTPKPSFLKYQALARAASK